MKYILLILALIAFSCNQPENKNTKPLTIQPKEVLVPDTVYTELVTHLLAQDSNLVSECNLITTFEPLFNMGEHGMVKVEELDSLFTPDDLPFIQSQFERMEEFQMPNEAVKGKVLISTKAFLAYRSQNPSGSFQQYLDKVYDSGEYCIVAKPVFSLDKKTAIVHTGYVCGGMCGSGSTAIYRKVNNKWKKVKDISTWIS